MVVKRRNRRTPHRRRQKQPPPQQQQLQKTETKTDKTFCKNECEDFQYCLEHLLVKEKELGLSMISRIQTF